MKTEERQRLERKFWDRNASRYDRILEHVGRAYAKILETALTLLDEEKDILEAGTGTGFVALGIASRARRVEACDISSRMIAVAEGKREELGLENVRFSVQDCCTLEFPDSSFDLVIASNVLHLLFQPELAVSEMKRVLRPEGRILAPTFCHGQNLLSHLISRLALLRGFRTRHRWSVESLSDFFGDCGLRVVQVTVHPGPVPLAIPVLETCPFHDPERSGNDE
jgi:ubiquinone/menaquinone biosynthesis C-methylase UbiE